MKLPLQITFRNTSRSDALEAHIRMKAEKLDQFCDAIMSCRVMVEASHRHHHKGNLYHARIDITVPDRELVVSRDPKDNRAHEDAYDETQRNSNPRTQIRFVFGCHKTLPMSQRSRMYRA